MALIQDAVSMLVVGTESGMVLLLEPSGTAMAQRMQLPSAPVFMAITGFNIYHFLFPPPTSYLPITTKANTNSRVHTRTHARARTHTCMHIQTTHYPPATTFPPMTYAWFPKAISPRSSRGSLIT